MRLGRHYRIQIRTTDAGCHYAVKVDLKGNERERGPVVPPSKKHEAEQHAANYRRFGAWEKS